MVWKFVMCALMVLSLFGAEAFSAPAPRTPAPTPSGAAVMSPWLQRGAAADKFPNPLAEAGQWCYQNEQKQRLTEAYIIARTWGFFLHAEKRVAGKDCSDVGRALSPMWLLVAQPRESSRPPCVLRLDFFGSTNRANPGLSRTETRVTGLSGGPQGFQEIFGFNLPNPQSGIPTPDLPFFSGALEAEQDFQNCLRRNIGGVVVRNVVYRWKVVPARNDQGQAERRLCLSANYIVD